MRLSNLTSVPPALTRPLPLAIGLIPLFGLAAFAAGDLPGLAIFLVSLSAGVVVTRLLLPPGRGLRDALTGLPLRDGLVAAIDRSLAAARRDSVIGVFVLELDGFRELEQRHDRTTVERLMGITARRLRSVLRETDLVCRLDGAGFGVALAPSRRLDLEPAVQLAGRLQRAISEPISISGMNFYLSAAIGFSLSTRHRSPTAEDIVQGASLAMIEAQRSGPAGIRSYSDGMRARVASRSILATEVAEAFDRGEITAYFQPQVSTRTGEVTGFEALARWHHPLRGLIPPVEFLPALAQAGRMDRLGETMVREGLAALRHWDGLGLRIPRVGVNFSNAELADPGLVDRIGWELDRHDLTPDRLVIEVLESVVANRAEDVVMRNLAGLARLGCCLDLDDFGTGHASITSIRRFSIERIKIDRSFVTRIDDDPEQQKMVGAILTMAERLGLDTLAEGVETEGERAMLARLGCGHIQGFGIARPMPLSETADWIRAQSRARPETRPDARADGGPVQLRIV
jgi:diguanylate cyclase (GGDEF)-like protein